MFTSSFYLRYREWQVQNLPTAPTRSPLWLQIIVMMGNMLERPLIKKDFESKYPLVVEAMDAKMDDSRQIYEHQMSIIREGKRAPIHVNMSSVAGNLRWSWELRERVRIPMALFKGLKHP